MSATFPSLCLARATFLLFPTASPCARRLRGFQAALERRARRTESARCVSQAALASGRGDLDPPRSAAQATRTRLDSMLGDLHGALSEGQWEHALRFFFQSIDASGRDSGDVEQAYSQLVHGTCPAVASYRQAVRVHMRRIVPDDNARRRPLQSGPVRGRPDGFQEELGEG